MLIVFGIYIGYGLRCFFLLINFYFCFVFKGKIVVFKKDDDVDDDDEDVVEDEEGFFRRNYLWVIFFVVIGFSCGVLVIMIIIVVVMVMCWMWFSNNIKIVFVDEDVEGVFEKSYFVNM